MKSIWKSNQEQLQFNKWAFIGLGVVGLALWIFNTNLFLNIISK